MVSIEFSQERPDTADALALITELEAELDPLYPRQSRHGYSVEKLLREGVHFFVLRADGAAAGCGGIQFYGQTYGELKRMYVRPRYRGLGLGSAMLQELIAFTRRAGVNTVRLETGIYQREAIHLYERFGFQRVHPFGDYVDDPLSLFYEKSWRNDGSRRQGEK